MDQIIVMNPFARQLRTDKTLRTRLLALMHRKTAIIEAQTVSGLLDTLEQHAKTHDSLANVTVYVVGGDGVFNEVLNWTLSQPKEKRPNLMPVGGGQFNFMCKFVGLKSTDPSKNLAEIFSGRIRPQAKAWKPIRIEDSLSGEHRYGAVIGNGILCDSIEWYEEMGKGDMLSVLKLIGAAMADFGKNTLHNKTGRIKPVSGTITIDRNDLPCNQYAGFMIGAVSEFLPGCKPFHNKPTPDAFSAIVYWGNLAALAASVPMLWHGWASPLTDLRTFNRTAKSITIKTTDPRLLIDGDLFTWPTPAGENPPRTLLATYGPEIQLLHAV